MNKNEEGYYYWMLYLMKYWFFINSWKFIKGWILIIYWYIVLLFVYIYIYKWGLILVLLKNVLFIILDFNERLKIDFVVFLNWICYCVINGYYLIKKIMIRNLI